MNPNNNTDLLNALNDCINRLNRGETLSDCLRAHPRQTAQLLPLLEVLIATRPLLVVPSLEVTQAQDRVRFRIAEALAEPITLPVNTGMRPVLVGMFILLLIIGAVTFALAQWMPTPPAPVIDTVTATSSHTLTVTPTATATPSHTATVVPTDTATPSHTATVVPTDTATLSPTATATPTATMTPSPTATLPTQAAATSAGCMVSPPADWVRYTVRSGDTLSGLAVATNTTLERLITVNCLENPRLLFVGQHLYLPRLPVQPGQPGDGGGGMLPTPGQAAPTPVPGNPGDTDDDNGDDGDDDDGDDDN